MAKDRRTDFSSLMPQQPAPTKQVKSADEAIRAIHGDKTKRITLDIALPLHAKIKMRCFEQGITMKDFLLDLAARELGV
ncbi:MAG: hypothetical protein IPN76_30110 [Saprospiraceae bacterium]|jgi:hypothetical protein|nr:hypothetical protein [Saprospiraceae bacterium]